MQRIFNHDGFGLLAELAGTSCTPADADRVLVVPLAAAGFTAIDWCICLELFEDLLAKGVDGISLDFERKAPFFPDGVPQGERFAACTRFVRAARELTDKHLIARVAYQPEKGEPQGQQPLAWMQESLLDAVIPATHNHEPDPYDWLPDEFFAAAKRSPRPCAVWPQLWPTPEPWNAGRNRRHASEAVQHRCAALHAAGADGAYFFNFCCYGALETILNRSQI